MIYHVTFLTFRQSLDIMKRPQKFETISHLIWYLLSKHQIMWEIVSNFVAFLENLNFKPTKMSTFLENKGI